MDKVEILRRSAPILEPHPQVRFGYLFGSFNEGFQRAHSDVDIAVYLADPVTHQESFDIRLMVGTELESALGRRTDLVVLNHAPIVLAFHAIRGEIILERDPDEHALVVAGIMSRYYDHRPFRRFYERVIAERAKAGLLGVRKQ